MKKFNLKLPRNTWGQLKTKYPADSEFINDDDFTKGTKNIDTTVKGVITKRKGSVPYNITPLASPFKDQYESIFEDGVRHLIAIQSGEIKFSSGDEVFNTVENGTGFTAESNFQFVTLNNKVYLGNGVNPGQVYDRVTNYGGVVYTAPRMKDMGCQTPTTAATLQSQTGSGEVPEEPSGYRYKVAFVFYGNEESNGGPESALISVGAGGSDITLESIPIGGYGVTARNIYRTIDGRNDYLSVGTISDNTTVTFVDDQPAGVIAIALNHDIPPTFGGITEYQEAAWLHKITGEPFTLRFSNKGQPDIMPDKNFIICNQQDPIEGKISFRGVLIILNRNSMGQVIGNNFFNYQYRSIQNSVGCVDERSIQIRTIRGIPILVWLSDKGIYGYNGNSVDYLSDSIEDLINFNIQQAQFNKAKQEFTADADFNGLTNSDGIVVTGNNLTTINPLKKYSSQADWDGGEIHNLATSQGEASIKDITDKTFGREETGTQLSGVISPGGVIQLPTIGNYEGQSLSGSFRIPQLAFDFAFRSKIAYAFETGDGLGTLASINFTAIGYFSTFIPVTGFIQIKVYRDNEFNSPGNLLATSPNIGLSASSSGAFHFPISWSPNLILDANTRYWISYELVSPGSPGLISLGGKITNFTSPIPIKYQSPNLDSDWHTVQSSESDPAGSHTNQFSFIQTVQSDSGTWISNDYDTESIYIDGQITYNHTTENDTTVSGVSMSHLVQIQGSNTETTPRFWVTVQEYTDPAVGPLSFTPATEYRFWRIVVTMTTPDNRNSGGNLGTPRMTSDSSLDYPDDGTWESLGFFTSSDVTSFESLTPSPSSGVVIEIATSATLVGGYSSFSSLASATPNTYAKIRITLNSGLVQEIEFLWEISSVAEIPSGVPIDTSDNNAGWNIFLATVIDNGGTFQFAMQSNVSDSGFSEPSYVNISPSAFPSGVSVNRFAWWRVTIISTANNVPVIGAVIPQWYLSSVDSVRVASLFFNRTYYLAAAKFGSLTNNILAVFDGENRWRVYEDINIATMGLFFNDPYFGSADSGVLYKFLEGELDRNTDTIKLDVRTRAFDFGKLDPAASDKVKLIKQVEVRFANTGATYQVHYSIDEGQNFFLMFTDTGDNFYSTSEDGGIVPVRFRVNYDLGEPFSGRTIMIRITSNDNKPAQIHNIRFKGFIREADVINVAS